ncbi:hypothetical protein SD457_21205 [Coprobacillaceae bacterium CR2/5/TPMF4]|nr:hypothetical protein SD457_21205 [Coprobacillaceae bacterium CR2/5/TPMF4]
MNLEAELEQLSLEIKNSQKLLLALGDEIRQDIILMMMESGDCLGMRVGDIAKRPIYQEQLYHIIFRF